MVSEINIHNRRYLGAKSKLLDFIERVIEKECSNCVSFLDLFAGTGVVANRFFPKRKIIVNDILYSNFHSYQTWFGQAKISKQKLIKIIKDFNETHVNIDNYFSKSFSNTYFTKNNARKIGYIRDQIDFLFDSKKITPREKSVLLTALIYAADRVANTCGHYDAFRKKIDRNVDLQLSLPEYNKRKDNFADIYNEDANELIKKVYADIVYIDPPYNSRQYGDAYHLLENLVNWNKPKLIGVAKKFEDRKKIKSSYCTNKAPKVFEDLIKTIKSKFIVVSYNNTEKKGDGRSHAKISQEDLIRILKNKGALKIFKQKHPQFNAGKTNVENHQEFLYVCKVK
jgi:adenine-specific DNA-methyltransferase